MSRYVNSNSTMGILGFILMGVLAAGLIGGIANWIADDWNKPTLQSVVETRVVVVEASPGDGTLGTGFLIAPDIVLTAGHVATALRDTAQVYDYDGNIAKVDSIWTGAWAGGNGSDIALLFLADPISAISATFPANCAVDNMTYGDPLMMVGAHTRVAEPVVISMTVMSAFIEDTDIRGFMNYLTVQADIIPGMSGSAVLNEDHELVGVVIRLFNDADYAHITAGPIVCAVVDEADALRNVARHVDGTY